MKTGNPEISFRQMKQGEETDVVDLVLEVFTEFVAPHFSEDGISEFKTFVNASTLEERFQSGNSIIVAMFKSEIIGVIEMRDNRHVALLFVKTSFQKRGVAERMLGEAIKVCGQKNPDIKTITVNSSPNAYMAYRSLGFKGENDVKTVNGIRFIPMTLELDQYCGQPTRYQALKDQTT